MQTYFSIGLLTGASLAFITSYFIVKSFEKKRKKNKARLIYENPSIPKILEDFIDDEKAYSPNSKRRVLGNTERREAEIEYRARRARQQPGNDTEH